MSETNGNEKQPVGRPTIKTDAILDDICLRLASGETLCGICTDERMPGFTTVKTWLRDDEQFRASYVRAREDQADYFADEVVDVGRSATKETAGAVREHINALTWAASKINKSKYGDKGTDINISNTVVTLTQADQVQLQERRKKAEAQLLLPDQPTSSPAG